MSQSGPSLRRRPRRSGERGQVLVLFVLFLVVLLGAAALTVDYGTWLAARRTYQANADAAALAGAHYLASPDADNCISEFPSNPNAPAFCARTDSWKYLNDNLDLGLQPSDITSYATNNTAATGVVVGAYTLWVDTPPNSAGSAYTGTLGGNTRVIFVRVQANQQPYFARVFSSSSVTVPAWATAGVFPNRFAVITLRRPTDAGPSNAQDITLAGTNSTLTVIDGDLGGNWGMKLNSSATLQMGAVGGTGYQPAPYLIDNVSCGNSCWSTSQIQGQTYDANGLSSMFPPSGALPLPGFIQDPNYPPPPGLTSGAPAAALPPSIPVGDSSGRVTITHNAAPINDSSGNPLTCDPATASKIGPGWYSSITVQSGGCLILDPLNHHSNPNNPLLDVATPIGSSQLPGVFYVTGTININQSLVVGDGVTVIMRPSGSNNQLSLGAHQIMDLNRGCVTQSTGVTSTSANYCDGQGEALGAWTTKGASSYRWNGTTWVYQTNEESDPATYGRGVALYVLKPSQYQTNPAVDANTTVIQANAGAAFAWDGVTYAPHDNVSVAGQPDHNGVGQLVSWTFTFNGGTSVTQTYKGPDEGYPILLEPCVSGNGGAC